MERPDERTPPVGPALHYAADYDEQPMVDGAQRGQGLKDLAGGAVLIAIGFAYGGSVFLGTADVIDWVFDGLGTFWVLKGLYLTFTA
ncbi:MAG: hypothetical protein OER88_14850 [Planctomycetota bacterium]|nr:hypothetical protein [Planctomycetota bacterium]